MHWRNIQKKENMNLRGRFHTYSDEDSSDDETDVDGLEPSVIEQHFEKIPPQA